MANDRLLDIHAVCRLLGTTSRTLRYYEEKRLISSTKSPFSTRRQYTPEQIERIRIVLMLRSLGLPVKEIKALQGEGMDLRNVILTHRARIRASIERKQREIFFLNEALSVIDAGGDLFDSTRSDTHTESDPALLAVAQRCAGAIVRGEHELLYAHLSEPMQAYMPREVYERVRSDTLEPLGGLVAEGELSVDARFPHIVYQSVWYEKLGLRIKFVFHGGKIAGLWFDYEEL